MRDIGLKHRLLSREAGKEIAVDGVETVPVIVIEARPGCRIEKPCEMAYGQSPISGFGGWRALAYIIEDRLGVGLGGERGFVRVVPRSFLLLITQHFVCLL